MFSRKLTYRRPKALSFNFPKTMSPAKKTSSAAFGFSHGIMRFNFKGLFKSDDGAADVETFLLDF